MNEKCPSTCAPSFVEIRLIRFPPSLQCKFGTMASPASSSKRRLHPKIVNTLVGKPMWKSQELVELLNQEIDKRNALKAKMEAAANEAERLTMEGQKDVQEEVEYLNRLFISVKGLINKMIRDKLPNRLDDPEFYQNVVKVDDLEVSSAYLLVLQFYTATSEQIDINLESGLEASAIELFDRLKVVEYSYLDVAECDNLRFMGKSVITYWEEKLINKLSREFEQLLDSFGWPIRLKTATPTMESHEKFRKCVLNISRISTNSHARAAEIAMCENSDYFLPIMPIQIMMRPLHRRFQFHFLSDKPTSDSSKPEWYFSQVKQWVYDLVPFVKTHLEPVTVSEIEVSSIIEFVRCVTEMLIIKVDAHLNEDSRDGVFVKILEESIAFENEIGDFVAGNVELGPCSDSFLPAFVNTVFSRSGILDLWLAAEQRACLKKLDDMFSSPSAWNKPVVPGPPEIVDLFIAAIRSLTDRFAHLQEVPQRRQFLHLLNDLLEEFHVRCLQTWKSKLEVGDDFLVDYITANALCCIHDTLQDWEYLPFFASLSVVNTTTANEEGATNEDGSLKPQENEPLRERDENGLFSDVCRLYMCLADEILAKWCLKVVKKAKEELKPYAKLKWQSFESSSPPGSLSEQIVRIVQTLKDLGKAVFSSMDPKSADKWMKKLAVQIDDALMELVVLPNQFSRAGVLQLSYDATTGIFPIFSDNGISENLFMGNFISSLTILKISTGEAMLLYDTLMNGSFEAHEVALAELNISICQTEVIKILRNRCDLHI